MDELKTIRWQQRFQNLDKAYSQLERGLAIKHPSDIERQGVIQSFEFTFELAWKTLQDYLEAQGVTCQFPREVIKKAFHHEIISEGKLWLDMLGKRDLLAHTYDESLATEAYRLIQQDFTPQISKLVQWLRECNASERN